MSFADAWTPECLAEMLDELGEPVIWRRGAAPGVSVSAVVIRQQAMRQRDDVRSTRYLALAQLIVRTADLPGAVGLEKDTVNLPLMLGAAAVDWSVIGLSKDFGNGLARFDIEHRAARQYVASGVDR